MYKVKVAVLLLTLSLCRQGLAGPTCYSCVGISDPRNCLHQEICLDDQECYTERLVTDSMLETYNLGCGSRAACSQAGTSIIGRKRNLPLLHMRKDISKREITVCSECCTTTGCNAQLCHNREVDLQQDFPATQEVYVRLVGGGSPYDGLVQVYYNGQWGTICDDQWTGNNAKVICKMLGYNGVGAGGVQGGVYTSVTTGHIWLDEVNCLGSEDSIMQCQKSPWGVNDCTHSEDAAVICSSVTPQDNVIYLVDTGLGGVMIRMNLRTLSYVIFPIDRLYHITTFDYDPVEGRIYFGDPVLKQILSINFHGEDPHLLRQFDPNSVIEKVEVDPLNRKVFYTDDGNNVIGVMNMDGSNYQEIITSGLDKPREMILDPRNRKVYWTDWGSNPKIERSDYDGSNRQVIANTGFQWPNGMAIDFNENRIYFVDAGTDNIEVMDLTGGNRKVILNDPGAHFFSVDIFGDYLYYTDWNHNSLMRVRKDGTEKSMVGPPSFQQLSDIRIFQYSAELPGVSTAAPVQFDPSHIFVRVHGAATLGYVEVYANGEWGTICDDNWDDLDAAVICRMVGLSATGARAISNGITGHGNQLIVLDEVSCKGTEEHLAYCNLNPDSWTHHDCSHNEDAGVVCAMDNTEDNFLVFTDAHNGLLTHMYTKTYSYTIIPLPGNTPNVVAAVFNPTDRRIYYTVVIQSPGSQIYSVHLDGSQPLLIKQLPLNSVADGIAVDTTGQKIFYTDTGRNIIASMNLDGTNEQIIISTQLDEPRAIVLDPANSVMYWTDWGSSPKIEKSNYDGSNRRTIVSTTLHLPNGLELDKQSGLLYFCDAGTHAIESIGTDGQNRKQVFLDNSAHFFDLHVTSDFIYYSDWNKHGVMRLNKDGSGQTMVGPPTFLRISGLTGYESGN